MTRRKIATDPCRLQEIAATNSSGRISGKQSICRPFPFEGENWICTGAMSEGMEWRNAECFRLCDPVIWAGKYPDIEPRTYDKHDFFSDLRADWGGYHAMIVTSNGQQMILEGPPVIFIEGAATEYRKQPSLF